MGHLITLHSRVARRINPSNLRSSCSLSSSNSSQIRMLPPPPPPRPHPRHILPLLDLSLRSQDHISGVRYYQHSTYHQCASRDAVENPQPPPQLRYIVGLLYIRSEGLLYLHFPARGLALAGTRPQREGGGGGGGLYGPQNCRMEQCALSAPEAPEILF